MKQVSFSGTQNASGISNPITSYLNLAHYAVKVSERYTAADERMRDKDFPKRMLGIWRKIHAVPDGDKRREFENYVLEGFRNLPKELDEFCGSSDPKKWVYEEKHYAMGFLNVAVAHYLHVFVPAMFGKESKKFTDEEKQEVRELVLYLHEKIVKSGKLLHLFQFAALDFGLPPEELTHPEIGKCTIEDIDPLFKTIRGQLFQDFKMKVGGYGGYSLVMHNTFPEFFGFAMFLEEAAKKYFS